MPDFLIWPAVAVICIIVIGIAALLILRPALLRLFDRISKVSKDGVALESSQERRSDSSPMQLSFPELMNMPISATVLERERNIKDQLHDLNLQNDSEKIEALIRVTATARIETEFTNIAHTIFGSQVELLVLLAGTPQGATMSHAEEIFKQAQELYPEIHNDRTLEVWLKYLLSNNLITVEKDKMDISRVGGDFLKFLVDARIAYPRKG